MQAFGRVHGAILAIYTQISTLFCFHMSSKLSSPLLASKLLLSNRAYIFRDILYNEYRCKTIQNLMLDARLAVTFDMQRTFFENGLSVWLFLLSWNAKPHCNSIVWRKTVAASLERTAIDFTLLI